MAQFTIRIPDELHVRIKDAAAEDKRSVNGEVEWLLDGMLAMRAIGRQLDGKAVHHIDGNPCNNDPANLRIVDPKENGR